MKLIHFALLLFLTTNIQAWQGTDLSFENTINCNYQKTNTPDEKNFLYQKCLTYKTIYDKYRTFVSHYNLKNKLDEKYSMKFHNIWAEYKYKEHLFTSLKESKSFDSKSLKHNQLQWEQDALRTTYEHIKIEEPTIRINYYNKMKEWFRGGEGQKLSDHGLIQTHRLRQTNVKEGLNMKYQFRMNTSYTSLIAIEEELTKRGLPFNSINFKIGF